MNEIVQNSVQLVENLLKKREIHPYEELRIRSEWCWHYLRSCDEEN